MERMTTTRIKKETRPGVYRCDPTLYIRVYSETSKSFIQKLTLRKGRRIEIGLGGWPVVSLDEAREIAFENRRAVRAGRNPLAEKRATEQETVKPTFGVCASQWFEENRAAWKSDKTVVNTWSMIEAHALPAFGETPVDQITAPQVILLLGALYAKRPSTGRKLRQRLNAIFAWAVAHEFCTTNPAGPSISAALPKASAGKTEHHTAVPHGDLAGTLAALDNAERGSKTAKLAIRFVALTAVRSGEALGATWAEIDLERATWTIPAERMKAATDHRVPLSDAALAVLTQARKLGKGELVFPAMTTGDVMDGARLREALTLTGLNDRMTVHGLRSTFRDWAAEVADADHAVMELSLAHAVGSQVERAYARSDLFDRRRALMQSWSDYLSGTEGGNVVALHA